MVDIRRVTDDFAVTSQLRPEELAEAAAQGYRLIVNNRPDGEAPGQPSADAVAAAAEAAGLGYVHVPFAGRATPEDVQAVHDAVAGAKGPVLAFCRSGTRSITVWARGQLQAGDRSRDELVRLAGEAGYDLSASL